ncbi:MAG: 4-hydroxy-3-methylbut-2-enyl diphosphate reductase [Candidatus Omnitrophica bacterium]|nr:4-hydroxy-3-methylbut-2-enyl diphosphate reductase [Candidatus Omnitrophota bacterium]
MKITIAKSAGFCFGVKRALQISLKTATSKKNAYMLGDIVHNEDVVSRIRKAGIKKIKKIGRGNAKTLLIRAHGAPLDTIKKAKRCGYRIVDATCPMVKEIHRIAARMERLGYKIIIIGDKKHDEVQGIMGQLKGKAIVIHDLKTIPINIISKIKKAAVVVQSTQNLDKVSKIVDVLNKTVEKTEFFNTICRPTRIKQQEIKKLPLKNEVIIIIGSKTSANTKRLYEIAKNLNTRSYWVQSKRDLKPSWFKDIRNVGVTAGASTPDSTTKEVVERIKEIA